MGGKGLVLGGFTMTGFCGFFEDITINRKL